MNGHGTVSTVDRVTGVDDARQEIQGKLPRGPFEFATDLSFEEIKPAKKTEPTEKRFREALYRDARYATAGSVYLRAFGMSQALREIYDGSKQLRDGGVV